MQEISDKGPQCLVDPAQVAGMVLAWGKPILIILVTQCRRLPQCHSAYLTFAPQRFVTKLLL